METGMKTPNDRFGVIAMPSLTYALQGESLLQNEGIYARVIKLPAGATKKGCAYGLEVDSRMLNEAAALIDRKGVKRGELLP